MGLTGQGTRDCEALLLPTGEPSGWPISQAGKINERQQFVGAAPARTSGHSG